MEKKYPIGEEHLQPIPEPVGAFIHSQDDIMKKAVITGNGYYWHYVDVITLLTRYLDYKKQVAPQGIGWVKGDYDRLFDQLKAEPERKIVCWVNYEWGLRGEKKELLRDICSIMGRVMGFNARGIGYGGSEIMIGWEDERKYFLEECERLNAQWLDESAGEKEVNP